MKAQKKTKQKKQPVSLGGPTTVRKADVSFTYRLGGGPLVGGGVGWGGMP